MQTQPNIYRDNISTKYYSKHYKRTDIELTLKNFLQNATVELSKINQFFNVEISLTRNV